MGSWRMLACLARGNLLDILQEGFTEVNACPKSHTDLAGARQHAFVQHLSGIVMSPSAFSALRNREGVK